MTDKRKPDMSEIYNTVVDLDTGSIKYSGMTGQRWTRIPTLKVATVPSPRFVRLKVT